jgi:hypothetical protein
MTAVEMQRSCKVREFFRAKNFVGLPENCSTGIERPGPIHERIGPGLVVLKESRSFRSLAKD